MKWINIFDKEQTLVNAEKLEVINTLDEIPEDNNEIIYQIEFEIGDTTYKFGYESKEKRNKAYYSIMEQLGVQRIKKEEGTTWKDYL